MQPTMGLIGRTGQPGIFLRSILFTVFSLLPLGSPSADAQLVESAPSSGAEPTEIVWRMVALNETRAKRLDYFTALRSYHLECHRLNGSMVADMHVRVTYRAGSGKKVQIVDQSGSHLLLNHVLKRLLVTEEQESRRQTAALTPFNYNFTFNAETTEAGRTLYVFTVEPKKNNGLLCRGRIWIDAEDYAVVRMEAQPAEKPSFWIKGAELHNMYEKSGEFWLPGVSQSESRLQTGGTASLTIEYGTYTSDDPRKDTRAGPDQLAAHKVDPR